MPEGDPGVLCFQHCDPTSKIFCLELPEECPQCGLNLGTLRIPPFILPYPFGKAKNLSSSLVIKPTRGDFLHHYQNSVDLHIGITNSKGIVYEFDRSGLHVGERPWNWEQCLSIQVSKDRSPLWLDYWDYTLDVVATLKRWDPKKYSEDKHNCYTFVMTFLRLLALEELKPSLKNKTQFCHDFIVSRTRIAAKYILLYRRVIKDGVSVIKCLLPKQPPIKEVLNASSKDSSGSGPVSL